jgi:hypothetical protein
VVKRKGSALPPCPSFEWPAPLIGKEGQSV